MTSISFNGVDISDMVYNVTVIAPWLHFPWYDWEDFREDVPAVFRASVDPHEGHDLMYRRDARGYEFKCRTCEKQREATAAERKLTETIRAARAELEQS